MIRGSRMMLFAVLYAMAACGVIGYMVGEWRAERAEHALDLQRRITDAIYRAQKGA